MEEFLNLLEGESSTVCLASKAMGHIKLVEDLSLQTDIKNVDPELVEYARNLEGEKQIFIRGIEQKMLKAHRDERTDLNPLIALNSLSCK